MIRAIDIIHRLSERWVTDTSNGRPFEVVENASTWREAAKFLRDDLQEVVTIKHASPILRYGYNAETKEIKAWVGYHATHEQIYPDLSDDTWDDSIFGYIEVKKRLSVAVSFNGTYKHLKELPRDLQSFLRGTELVFSIPDKLIR
jgi:hypothetical protein